MAESHIQVAADADGKMLQTFASDRGETGNNGQTLSHTEGVTLCDTNGDPITALPVTDNGGSLTVDGTFFQATQPVSIAAAVAVTDNAGSLTVDNNGTFAVQASIAAAQTLSTVTT